MQTKKTIQQPHILKIQFFKKRFLQILDYIGGEKSIIAASEIRKLPDIALNGFHDIYLTTKIIFITLNQFAKDDISKLSDDIIKQNLFIALFDSDIESIDNESIDEIFAFCRKNPKENITDCLSLKFSYPPEIGFDFFSELEELKSSCCTFIEFFDKNIESINKIADNIIDPLIIKNTYQGPQQEGILEDAVFLTDPGDQKIIKNQGILVIDQMIPCFAVVIIAENDNKEIACLGKHIFPGEYQFSKEDHKILYEDLHQLINSLKSEGYANSPRMFVAGGSTTSLSLILKLIMFQWNIGQDSPLSIQNICLLPSYYSYFSHCLVRLFDGKCSLQVGGELYDNDNTLCKESGLKAKSFAHEPAKNINQTELNAEELDVSSLPSILSPLPAPDTDNDEWIHSSEERPIKRIKTNNPANEEVPIFANTANINFFNLPKPSPSSLNTKHDSSKPGDPGK